jgi:sugar-specific transcriptional regulator TrmB
MADIISSILDECIEKAGITTEKASAIERSIRQRYGGELAYIYKRSQHVEEKKQLINEALRAGYSVVQIEKLHDIPSSTIYRLINSKGG